jgi:pimeloyl-ACP methyl ester carboxylesterase
MIMNKLDLEYKIIGKGKTVIVIETGIGGSFYNWYSFVKEIKEDFTVVLYHRAGYGKSQTSNNPRTTRNIAEELNSLLNKIRIKEKFILMGHSFGGLCVQQYAKMYPNKLKSIILIDSTSYNFKQLYMLDTPVLSSHIEINKRVEWDIDFSKKSKDELKNENENRISEFRKRIPDIEMNDIEEFFTSPTLYKTTAEELKNWDVDSKDIRSISSFPNIPLTVIARDNKIAEKYWVNCNIPEKEATLYEAEWRKLQIELSKLSNKGKFIIAENSGHEIYLDRPDIIIQYLKTLI